MDALKLIPMAMSIIAVVGFVAVASIMAFGDFGDSMSDNNTLEFNATSSAKETLVTTTSLFPPVVWIAIAAIFITLAMGLLAYLKW